MLNAMGRLKTMVSRSAIAAALTPLAFLAAAPKADAVLRYDIFEQNGNTYVKATGSFTFTNFSVNANDCYSASNGNLNVTTTATADPTSFLNICTGPQLPNLAVLPLESTSFPVAGATSSMLAPIQAISSSGIPTFLVAQPELNPTFSFFQLALDPSYASGDPISSTSIFSGGFAANNITPPPITLPALIGSFQLAGGGDTVEVYFSPTPPSPSTSTVPAPLPLLGASAALAWSRKLRSRLAKI